MNLPRKRSLFGSVHNPQVALDFATLINSDHKISSPQVPVRPIIVNANAAAIATYKRAIELIHKTDLPEKKKQTKTAEPPSPSIIGYKQLNLQIPKLRSAIFPFLENYSASCQKTASP